ncbi:translation initiation factor eIF-2B subunit epsilon-like [Limulus polyphemus]|uniref:Translation initiation factor eIF2B subunit epsilon n=1 Tax=Limulus polyphemus TaxID=6850 RepID=A0ABM1BYD8_LIMPO|nr:translation initiation factor eIF-2B subunit epsilon-like [Limulus polyphemus]
MASSIKSSNRKGKTDEVIQQEDIIQAVVIADSFNKRFAPLTVCKPKVLLPLVNRPLLDYTLEFLSINGIQETFIFCCSHAQQIKDYISKSSWSNPDSHMSVTTIVSESFLSMGDVLRELDSKALIRSDFILLSGDTVSQIPVRDILLKHKKQQQKDKGMVMTLVFKKALPKHKTRCLEDECVVAVEPETERILHYQKVGHKKKIEFPLTVFQENNKVTLRYDLLDTHISICSPHVPPLFSDNFDYQTRDDFIRGVLINEEIMGNTVNLHLIDDGYAAQVSNLTMYDAISQDVIKRWSYPVVPDLLSLPGGRYSYLRHNIYKQKDVVLERHCILNENVVIGRGSKVGSRSSIINSVIGHDCEIGSNVHIDGCYMWNNVKVEDGCILQSCLLANNVVVKKGVTIHAGSVLSYNVVVGPDITVKCSTLLQAEPPSVDMDEFGDNETLEPSDSIVVDPNLVGAEGKGFLFHSSCESDDENDEFPKDIWGQTCQSGSEGDETSVPDSVEELSDGDSPPPDDLRLFYSEVLDSLLRGIEEKVKWENLVLEVNSSKYAYNVTMKEVNTLVMKAILEIPKQGSQKPLQPQMYLVALKPLLSQLLPLIKNYMKSKESQLDCLSALEEFGIVNEELGVIIMKVLHFLYEKDVLSEPVILEWYSNPPVLGDVDPAEQDLLRKR